MAIKQRTKSLQSRRSELSDTFFQLKILSKNEIADEQFPLFSEKIAEFGYPHLQPSGIDIFQMNVGKLCNQSCAHCHVDAAPDRTEVMTRATMERCLEIIADIRPQTVDLTGGAPEMNPHFRWFVEEVRRLGVPRIINRCNLTIIVANPKYYDLPDFFAQNRVEVVSSLPHFTKNRTDRQRGDGVFEDSVKALQMLNSVGYGVAGSNLTLNLVYNPSGTFLPSTQMELENEFKRQLKNRYNVVFNGLLTITNLPISRFLDYLLETENYESYMETLLEAFNPATIEGVMCRNTLSVGWNGFLYDCDFNQMLDLKVAAPASQHIDTFNAKALLERKIVLNQHCYGCTAGAGSSCGGEIAQQSKV